MATDLQIHITTGGDDLRGGNDNANVTLLFTDGHTLTERNINRGQRWKDHQTYTTVMRVGKQLHEIRGIRLETTASGGIGGDNWNVNNLRVVATQNGRTTTLLDKSGNPLHRFTGDDRSREWTWKSGNAVAPPKRSGFTAKEHGFNFTNSFTNHIIGDIKTYGLCGGMCYAALDYYYNRQPIPEQSTLPAEGSALRDYIYKRQLKAFQGGASKWAELIGTNIGNRDQEFFNWGLQTGSGRLGELMECIDSNRPMPIGLQTVGTSGPFSHYMVAVGYELGRYEGDLGPYQTDVCIFVYDPNHPNREMALVPDPTGKCYRLKGYPRSYWRTYFVDKRYRSQRPV
ncbi:hypothetical protein [Neolewinella litorea]|uniref:Uncharacterized protein n=1 Tax=Neolewinella litorea TaxID=2562452 RepID=A0A4S4NRL7_9BACT|nr:hypothetical protein [Neolewinella litorea]THH41855.1 hypothetical protein E4021_04510 [Neolewinella litorea]